MAKQIFEGLKVADFSWAAAGPQVSRELAEHGATVVRHREPPAPEPAEDFRPVQGRQAGHRPQRLLRRIQHQQAVHSPGHHQAQGQRDGAETGQMGRHRRREHEPRDHGRTGAGLRKLPQGESGGDLPQHLDAGSLRPQPPLQRRRPPRQCRQRILRHHRLAGQRPDDGIQRLFRLHRPVVLTDRHHGSAAEAAQDRQGHVHRAGADGMRSLLPGASPAELRGEREESGPSRQPRLLHVPARRLSLPRQRPLGGHRRAEREAVAVVLRRHRQPGVDQRPQVRHHPGPKAERGRTGQADR